MLEALTESARRGELTTDPRWDPTLRALVRLLDALNPPRGLRRRVAGSARKAGRTFVRTLTTTCGARGVWVENVERGAARAR
ncbi:hypothetical protein GCM10023350_28920 [Nocardioides endophyticus]|uniref:Uncharacterized protein n=1 Tax=Nocardioides endophyticus TaxID=1353775 RepID=A0ABP8YYW9_9ACTN